MKNTLIFHEIAAQAYGRDKAFTRAVKSAMVNPKETVIYNGKTWKVGKNKESKTHFYDRFIHIIKLHFSKSYAAKFDSTVTALNMALFDYNNAAALTERVRKRFINVTDEKLSAFEPLDTLDQQIAAAKDEIKSQETDLKSYFEERDLEIPQANIVMLEKQLNAVADKIERQKDELSVKVADLEKIRQEHPLLNTIGFYVNQENEIIHLNTTIQELLMRRETFKEAISEEKVRAEDLANDPAYAKLKEALTAAQEKLADLIKAKKTKEEIDVFIDQQELDFCIQACDLITRGLFKDATEKELEEVQNDSSGIHHLKGSNDLLIYRSALKKLELLQNHVKNQLVSLHKEPKINQAFFQMLYDPNISYARVLEWLKSDGDNWKIKDLERL